MDYTHYTGTRAVSDFMYKVYGWMSAALLITAGTAYYVANSPVMIEALYSNPGIVFTLMLVQLGLVFGISFGIMRMSFTTALGCFLLYSLTVGVTLSSIFLVYTAASIYSTFLVTSSVFGAMALYGYTTRRDLTSMGSMAVMLLFGLIVSQLVNMFLRSAQFDFILSAAGVVIFTLLTAYDAQKIKQLGQRLMMEDPSMTAKVAIIGALTLYLDFVNLFLYLLRFMGQRRRD